MRALARTHKHIHPYMHTYIHTYTHIHTYIHTYIHTHTHTYMHARIHTYIHTYVRTYLSTHTHLPTHTTSQILMLLIKLIPVGLNYYKACCYLNFLPYTASSVSSYKSHPKSQDGKFCYIYGYSLHVNACHISILCTPSTRPNPSKE
jgi:hypothetical protein